MSRFKFNKNPNFFIINKVGDLNRHIGSLKSMELNFNIEYEGDYVFLRYQGYEETFGGLTEKVDYLYRYDRSTYKLIEMFHEH